jgi:hypothetical protein
VHELQDRFPNACLIGGDRNFEQVVARVVGFAEAPWVVLDLPPRPNGEVILSMRRAHELCDELDDIAAASLLEGYIDAAQARVRFLR